MKIRLFAAAWTAVVCSAGPFVFPGQHPNYDVQFTREEVRPFADLSILADEFPQTTRVYQPPLIGYLSPVNPAKWIIWTTLAPASDPFIEMALQGFDGNPPPQPPPDGPVTPPNPAGIPEPATGTSLALGLSLLAVCFLLKFRRRRH